MLSFCDRVPTDRLGPTDGQSDVSPFLWKGDTKNYNQVKQPIC